MSECIVKMEMPETCYDCAFFCDDGPAEYCYVRHHNHAKSDCVISHEVARTGRMAWCSIICALSEGHGRLVDADALIGKIKQREVGFMQSELNPPTIVCEVFERTKGDVCELIDHAPTIDAVPVRHGEWEQVEVIDYDGISMNDDAARCTVCGHVEQSVYWARTYYHYCPNCGAIMDGKEEADDKA